MFENLSDLLRERHSDLVQLRASVANECPNLPIPDDVWLLRFLVHTTLRKAIPRVRDMLLFRQKHKLDEIAAQIETKGLQPKDFPHYEEMSRCCPQTILFGFTRDNTPYGIEMHGLNDLASLLKTLTYEQFYRFNLYKLEYIRLLVHKMSLRSGTLVRFCVVADLKGLGMRHANPSFLSWFKDVCSDSQNHFREMVGKVFCVNSNAAFYFIWKIVKPALSEKTLEKVTLLQSDLNQLYGHIAQSQLPKFLGGEIANDYMFEFDMRDTHPDPSHPIRDSRSLLPVSPSALPLAEPDHPPLVLTQSLADFHDALVREKTAEPDSDSDVDFVETSDACDSSLTGPRLVDVLSVNYPSPNLTRVSKPPGSPKYSSDDRINKQLSSSGGVFAVKRHQNNHVELEMGSVDERMTNSSHGASSRTPEKSSQRSQQSAISVMGPDKRLKYLDYLYAIWVIVFVGLLVNSGAASSDLRLKVTIPLPVLVSIVLWSLILLTPLLMRFAFRRFASQQHISAQLLTAQTLKDIEQQHKEQQSRFHASTTALLRDLCNDVSDLESSLLRSGAPSFSQTRTVASGNNSTQTSKTQKDVDEGASRNPVDALIHCAGIVRGKSTLSLCAVPPSPVIRRRNEIEQQYSEMRKEVDTLVAMVRSHLSNFALSSAVMWRQLDHPKTT